MDERVAIWNTLHDGKVTAVSENNDVLTMFVSIPYLRRRMHPLGDSFVLTLTGVRRAECLDFDGAGTPRSINEELEVGTPRILGTESDSMPITVNTDMGEICLDFAGVSFALDTGQETDYETILAVCEDYWQEWEAKKRR